MASLFIGFFFLAFFSFFFFLFNFFIIYKLLTKQGSEAPNNSIHRILIVLASEISGSISENRFFFSPLNKTNNSLEKFWENVLQSPSRLQTQMEVNIKLNFPFSPF